MNPLLSLLASGVGLALVQVVAAVPWLAALNPEWFGSWRRGAAWGKNLRLVVPWLAGIAGAGVGLALFLGLSDLDPNGMQIWGGIYAAILQAQLTVAVLVLAFAALLQVWPKGGAVALSAFREGVRQPMFWFIVLVALVLLLLMPILPYFTFGEEYKMVKDLGYGVIMLSAAVFGVLTASTSISEEIEGRTAITLMSKPVSRRQFLLGKFVGILLAALAMVGILGWVFDGVLVFKLVYDREPLTNPQIVDAVKSSWEGPLGQGTAYFLRGAAWWLAHVISVWPGVLLGLCQAMVLLAIAVALATRLPMIVNVVSCAVVFFLANLTPQLQQVSQNRYALVRFMAQLFDTVLPGLDAFNLGSAIVRDTPLPPGPFAVYIGSVALYAMLYTSIALLVGLILFEDRDLA